MKRIKAWMMAMLLLGLALAPAIAGATAAEDPLPAQTEAVEEAADGFGDESIVLEQETEAGPGSEADQGTEKSIASLISDGVFVSSDAFTPTALDAPLGPHRITDNAMISAFGHGTVVYSFAQLRQIITNPTDNSSNANLTPLTGDVFMEGGQKVKTVRIFLGYTPGLNDQPVGASRDSIFLSDTTSAITMSTKLLKIQIMGFDPYEVMEKAGGNKDAKAYWQTLTLRNGAHFAAADGDDFISFAHGNYVSQNASHYAAIGNYKSNAVLELYHSDFTGPLLFTTTTQTASSSYTNCEIILDNANVVITNTTNKPAIRGPVVTVNKWTGGASSSITCASGTAGPLIEMVSSTRTGLRVGENGNGAFTVDLGGAGYLMSGVYTASTAITINDGSQFTLKGSGDANVGLLCDAASLNRITLGDGSSLIIPSPANGAHASTGTGTSPKALVQTTAAFTMGEGSVVSINHHAADGDYAKTLSIGSGGLRIPKDSSVTVVRPGGYGTVVEVKSAAAVVEGKLKIQRDTMGTGTATYGYVLTATSMTVGNTAGTIAGLVDINVSGGSDAIVLGTATGNALNIYRGSLLQLTMHSRPTGNAVQARDVTVHEGGTLSLSQNNHQNEATIAGLLNFEAKAGSTIWLKRHQGTSTGYGLFQFQSSGTRTLKIISPADLVLTNTQGPIVSTAGTGTGTIQATLTTQAMNYIKQSGEEQVWNNRGMTAFTINSTLSTTSQPPTVTSATATNLEGSRGVSPTSDVIGPTTFVLSATAPTNDLRMGSFGTITMDPLYRGDGARLVTGQCTPGNEARVLEYTLGLGDVPAVPLQQLGWSQYASGNISRTMSPFLTTDRSRVFLQVRRTATYVMPEYTATEKLSAYQYQDTEGKIWFTAGDLHFNDTGYAFHDTVVDRRDVGYAVTVNDTRGYTNASGVWQQPSQWTMYVKALDIFRQSNGGTSTLPGTTVAYRGLAPDSPKNLTPGTTVLLYSDRLTTQGVTQTTKTWPADAGFELHQKAMEGEVGAIYATKLEWTLLID